MRGHTASNIYRSRDAPRYILGRKFLYIQVRPQTHLLSLLDGLVLMFIGIGLICTPLLILTYLRVNAHKRERIEREGGKIDLSVEEMHELGDRAPTFKYTL